MFNIRACEERGWPATGLIIEPVFRSGESYAFSPGVAEDEAYKVCISVPSETFIAVDGSNNILGTYYIKPNQPALGSHVCNCGYIVGVNARGKGVASSLCVHSQGVATARGFRAMQYNLVVYTNEGAIRFWKKHGFEVIGTLPKAFQHPKICFVNAYVMYKQLGT